MAQHTAGIYVIGVTGGSGSGKTSFVRALAQQLGDHITVVSQDDYYRPQVQVPLDPKGVHNFDLPASIDSATMAVELRRILGGETVQRREYGFETAYREDQPALIDDTKDLGVLTYEPRPVLVVEGLFAMHEPELRELMDLRVFVDATDVAKLSRRIKRDRLERGLPLEDVLYRYEAHVLPAYEKYLKPHLATSHVVVNNGAEGFDLGLEVIVDHLRSRANA